MEFEEGLLGGFFCSEPGAGLRDGTDLFISGALSLSTLVALVVVLCEGVTLILGWLDCLDGTSGRAIWALMIAGSTGAPGTVGWLVGARLAGGVYLLGCPDWRGGKSSRRTPLYLSSSFS